MKNFKTKDLMVTINPESIHRHMVYDCEHQSKPGDTTGCTTCTHNTTGDGTNCTSCTHNTTVTCKPHSKPEHKEQEEHSIKAMELGKLKKAISRLQKKEYA